MLKVLRFLLLIILISSVSAGDNKYTITGRVTEKSTGKSLIGVNVFLDGTTIGTTTDRKGLYQIPNVKAGSYKLVVSMIGFETTTTNVEVQKGKELEYNFGLKEKTYEIKSVVVKDKEDFVWQRRFNKFKKLFFGATDFAKECEILNKEIIEFIETPDRLTGYAPKPLIIINSALGFKIECVLSEFYYDEVNDKTWFSQYNYFDKLEPKNEEEKLKWKKNREYAYETSFEYFVTWLQDEDRDFQRYKFIKSRYLEKNKYSATEESKIVYVSDIIRKNQDDSYRLIFPYYLKLSDVKYGTKSAIKLFYANVAVDKYGFINQTHALEVYGHFSEVGLADKLPNHYYVNPVEQRN
ncbi:MAG: carboxypeptidase-like regulatory domain-containing protein [Rhodothermaceae bacterium]